MRTRTTRDEKTASSLPRRYSESEIPGRSSCQSSLGRSSRAFGESARAVAARQTVNAPTMNAQVMNARRASGNRKPADNTPQNEDPLMDIIPPLPKPSHKLQFFPNFASQRESRGELEAARRGLRVLYFP